MEEKEGDGLTAPTLKLMKYTDCSDPSERATLIPDAMDYWNNDIHYWDRKTKYGKMLSNPYAFYRGTAPLYWFDFGEDDRLTSFGNEHTVTWLCADYHAYNAGSFDRDGNQGIYYGLNDFDESVVADYQLDLWRLAVSMKLIVNENDNNLSDNDLGNVLDAMSEKYLERMRHYATHGKPTSKEQITKHNAYGKLKDFLEIIEEKYTREKMLDKWCPSGKNGRRFDPSIEKLGSATFQEKQMVHEAMKKYGDTLEPPVDKDNFRVVDIARRLLAGTGSLGCDRFYVLVEDRRAGVERILDVKQQPMPSPYSYMGKVAKAKYDDHVQNDALRVVHAHRRLSFSPDPLMGWLEMDGRYYSVSERSPFKGSYPALLEEAHGKFKKLKLDSPTRYQKLAEQWASALASQHAYAMRNEEELQTLEQAIVDKVGDRDDEFKALVRSIAFEYAQQVSNDWKASIGLFKADEATTTFE